MKNFRDISHILDLPKNTDKMNVTQNLTSLRVQTKLETVVKPTQPSDNRVKYKD